MPKRCRPILALHEVSFFIHFRHAVWNWGGSDPRQNSFALKPDSDQAFSRQTCLEREWPTLDSSTQLVEDVPEMGTTKLAATT
jgi:hypothetical protein